MTHQKNAGEKMNNKALPKTSCDSYTVTSIKEMLSSLKVELLELVAVKGFAKAEVSKSLDRLADEALDKNKEHNLVD